MRINKKRLYSPVSAIDYSLSDDNLIALGSYDNRVYFTDIRALKKPLNFIKMTGGTGLT